MKIKEVKRIIETMEALGYGDGDLVINDSRDGDKSYPKATAKPMKTSSQGEHEANLVISYE